MVKYEVMFYFGVHHVNPFLMPSKVVEVEVDKTLEENEIIACALMKLEGDCPRIYSTRVKKSA
ncbi:hypothetical protein ABD91_26160 [Lysinibacillus sphaericus]|uniref:hypothetical protein n=1 Tax=Lysinibacillus sphaericus TaxID=1421 RepID=UPI0018CF80C0|nr:hypothetical protein [Lysinibacillus sphaericus]MBG9694217.1 hypothetical protein [Lysinibacillus sphaericus]